MDSLAKKTAFVKADSIYVQYIAKYPDQPQGYAFRAIAAKLADADTSKGTALPAIDAYISFLSKDTAKNKKSIISSYYYEIPYFAKIKDFQKALDAANAILVLDSANAYGKSVKDAATQQLLKPKAPATPPVKTPAKTPPVKNKTAAISLQKNKTV